MLETHHLDELTAVRSEISAIKLCLLNHRKTIISVDDLVRTYEKFTVEQLIDSLRAKEDSLRAKEDSLREKEAMLLKIELELAKQKTISMSGNRKCKSFHQLHL